MREMVRMVVVLSVICAASGLALSGLKAWTAPHIELAELTHVKGPALAGVFGETDNDPIAERTTVNLPGDKALLVFPARRGGALAAVAFETFAGGYGGDIGVMVGFDPQGKRIEGIGITTHKETPGVGSRTTLPAFTEQFRGHPFGPVALKSRGGDIDAVSGATISSTAVSAAVDKAVRLFRDNRQAILTALEEGGQ